MSSSKQTSKKGDNAGHLVKLEAADASMALMLTDSGNPDILERAKAILRKILTKNARVYEFDKAAAGLPAVSVFLACEEFKWRSLPGKMLTQKDCQAFSGLGPKLFRRSVDLCRRAKDLDESQISFPSLVKEYGGQMGLKYMEPIYQHFKKSCFDASIVNDHIWADNHILVVCAIFCWTFDKVYQNPTYSGPEIAFHCGLGWENVQKSMFYNLNPHCMDKMRELMTKDPPASDLSGGLPATNRLPPMAPMPGFPTPTMTVPRPTVPPSTVTAKPSLPYQSRLPPLTAPGGKAVVPPPPKQYTPYTSAEGLGLRFDAPPSASTSSAARPPASISSPSSTPMPPPNLPQHSQPSTPKASTPSVPPKAAPSAGAPVPPKAAPRTSTSAPMEIDLTQDDEDDEPQIGPNGRPKRKNAGKRRMDDGDISVTKPKDTKRRERTEALPTDAEWANRVDEELFVKQADETKTEKELRVYYAWKRMLSKMQVGEGPKLVGDDVILDFAVM